MLIERFIIHKYRIYISERQKLQQVKKNGFPSIIFQTYFRIRSDVDRQSRYVPSPEYFPRC